MSPYLHQALDLVAGKCGKGIGNLSKEDIAGAIAGAIADPIVGGEVASLFRPAQPCG